MAKLPKALIKKYGISKKAWTVFRSQGSRAKRKVFKPKVQSRVMAKKRFAGLKKYAKRHPRVAGFGNELIGVGVAAVAKPYVESLANSYIPSVMGAKPSSIAYAGAGFFLKKRGGMVGSVGKAMYYYGLVSAIGDITASFTGSGSSTGTATGANF